MTLQVLDKGFIRLDAAVADDLSVVRSARVSFNKGESEWEEGDEKLISYLMRNKHGSPFEHTFFRFHVKLPLFVVREWHRHRAGWSYNEWSGRYSKLEAEWYTPDPSDMRQQVGKPGAYKFEPLAEDVADLGIDSINRSAAQSFEAYEEMLEAGVAKEVARLTLPVNLYTQMYASCNARSLMHFLGLRNSEHAQLEIRRYAQAMEEFFCQLMPHTYAAFIESGRVSP